MSDTEDRSVHSRSGSSSKSVSPAKHRSDQANSKRSSSPKAKSKRSKVSKSRSRTPRKRKHSKRESQSRSRSRSYSRSRSRDRRISYEDGKSGRKDYSRSRYRRSPSRSPSSRRRHYKGDRDNPKESRCVGVFGMSLHTDERTVREVFERYGPLEEVQIVYDYHTGRSRGFAFVYYKYVEDACEAKENAPGTEIDGHKIRVDFSITERAHTPTPGTYMGSKGGRSFKNYGGGGGGGGRYRRSPSPYKRGGRYRSHSRSVSRGRY